MIKTLLHKTLLTVFMLFIFCKGLYGQNENIETALGLDPSSQKWQKIDTDHALIIFPEGAGHLAQRIAALLMAIGEQESGSVGGMAQKVPIILHSNSTIPAGVPFIGPWKSDWITTPSQLFFAGPVEWMDLLTIHEYRHHQQMARAKHGWFADFLRIGLGQTGWFVSMLMIQPTWFFEGDATYAETMLSNAGRGRTPNFDRDYKALRLSGRHYDYEKANRNSNRDFVPNIYREGFYMVSYARKHFGNDVWLKVLDDTYKRKGIFYPFSRSLKKYTGFTTKELYAATMKELDSIWQAEQNQLDLTSSTLRSAKPHKVFTSYRFPHYISDQSIIAEKSAFNEIKTYYRIDENGEEQKMFSPGFITEDHTNMSLAGNLMAWSENTFHERWGLKDYAVIKTYNLATGKKKKITAKSRYVSPAPSYDGKMMVTVWLKTDGTHDLVIINAETGKVINILPNPDQCFFSYPKWTEDGSAVVVTVTNKNGNAIRYYNIQNGDFEDLTEFDHQLITRTFPKGDYVYFSAAYTGIDNIFALSLEDKSLYQVTSTRFGAYDPAVSPDNSRLVFSEFTADGFELKEMELDPGRWRAYVKALPASFRHFESLTAQEGGNILEDIQDTTFVVGKFRPFLKSPINLHSWNPVIENPNYGINLTSENIMSTAKATAGFEYNSNEKSWKTSGTFSYGALYPIFDIGFSHGERNSELIYSESNTRYNGKWRENIISGGVRIPFNLSSGNYTTKMQLGGAYQYRDLQFKDEITNPLRNENFGAVSVAYGFERFQRGAKQFVAPRFGQTLSILYDQTINTTRNEGSKFQVDGGLYFPGLFKNHSFFTFGSYKKEDITDSYRFQDNFFPSRGYNNDIFVDGRFDSNAYDDIYRVSLNYAFPLGFPDLSLGSIAYVRGVKATLFYDHTEAMFGREKVFMRSAGVDISLDVPLFRLLQPEFIVRFVNRFDLPNAGQKSNFNVEFAFDIVDLVF